MDKPRLNVDDQNNGDIVQIITHEPKSKFQLTIREFSIAFVMSVIDKFKEFLSMLMMKYELQYNISDG